MKVVYEKGKGGKWRWQILDESGKTRGGPYAGQLTESQAKSDWQEVHGGVTKGHRGIIASQRDLLDSLQKDNEAYQKLNVTLEAENKRIHWNTLIISITAAIAGGVIGFIIYPLI